MKGDRKSESEKRHKLMAVTSRLQGLNTGLAIKGPVLVASTGNLTLSAAQTVDGIAVSSCDRVLVKDQTTNTENGIYQVETGSWTRTKDFDGALDVVRGTLAFVNAGTANGGRWYVVASTAGNIPGTNSITFSEASFPASLTAVLGTNGFAVDESEGTAQFSSGTVNIYVTDGNSLHVTTSTNTTITSLGEAPNAGAGRTLIFDGSGILTHNSAVLVLPSSADIQFMPGDIARFVADSTAQIRLSDYLAHNARDISVPETGVLPGAFMRNAGVSYISSDTTSDTATSIHLQAPIQGSHKEIISLSSATELIIETTATTHSFLTGATDATHVGTTAIYWRADNLFGASVILRGLNSTAPERVAWAITSRSLNVVSSTAF